MTIHLLMPWRRPAVAKVPPFPRKPTGGWGCADRLTKPGAEHTARQIVDVWARAGHFNVRAWSEPIDDPHVKEKEGRRVLYRVATNLVGGLPPR